MRDAIGNKIKVGDSIWHKLGVVKVKSITTHRLNRVIHPDKIIVITKLLGDKK